jgi:epoxide hydrolase-like predicted phosphatase
MTVQPIKAIIFDCFGVLTDDKWRTFVESLPDNQKQAARDVNRAYDNGAISESEFSQKLHDLTGRSPGLGGDDMVKNAELFDYIATLKATYKIGLLSNVASDWIRTTFLSASEQALFDAMIFSFEVGITKPDKRIFEIACQKLGVEPSEAVMIDDIDRYCDAARQTGMRAIVYQDFAQMKRELEHMLAG